jgi:regulator of protease activity HflC (stomatin/prohibitin superfamily)
MRQKAQTEIVVILVLAAVAIGILVIFMAANTVDEGHVGVVVTQGKASDTTLDPGFHFVTPFVSGIKEINLQPHSVSFEGQQVSSKELHNVIAKGSVTYALNKSDAVRIYREVGLDFPAQEIKKQVPHHLKSATGGYELTAFPTSRDVIAETMTLTLQQDMGKYGVTILDVIFEDFNYDDEYEASIRQAQVRTQQTRAAEEETKLKVEQNKQSVAAARAEADRNVALAGARAEAIELEATAQAKANQQLAASITPQLVEYERWKRWDGKMPQFVGAQDNLRLNTDVTPR